VEVQVEAGLVAQVGAQVVVLVGVRAEAGAAVPAETGAERRVAANGREDLRVTEKTNRGGKLCQEVIEQVLQDMEQ
jgi:hypothetical protein